ncbi:2-dehydro-3-deoxygalactonokinase [Roseitranquillus sediminis]|uniref:2-dehydro-3-deoxygalactonokinase n=1 Tax=Roseitranquillus sediminis TaxID=2809051 RepID=UPI001D0C5123|nr:2-dehydro-3-deoxygalactonokinase [Roseitranquillus sediminis]MBM9595792.1 2-dehydro-3-deoxygalactonokinase [Roseitranquillus sediminis]
MYGAEIEWIAVDWGTSNLRAWIIGADGAVLQRLTSDKGMSQLQRNEFEPTLTSLVQPFIKGERRVPVIVCGMAGARQGWVEAPYETAPCTPPGIGTALPLSIRSAPLEVRILPGVKQDSPADVMRGEETQIAGILAADPRFDGVICLPGTHTKWVQISAGEIVSFRTFMTGELFALLSRQSVLRHSVGGDGWDGDAFLAAVRDGMARPQALASSLFGLRAESLISDLAPDAARARLSGLLIGAELQAARPYWLGQDVRLVGAESLCRQYAEALSAEGLSVSVAGAEDMTLAGLAAARRALEEMQA